MDKVWYYMKRDRSKYGPYTDDYLISLIQKGILGANDYIWMPEMKHWLKVSNSIYSVYVPTDEEKEETVS